MYTLTLLDAVGIQKYIYNSNVLRENIGASDLVRHVTRVWPFEAVRDLGQTNVKNGRLIGTVRDLEDDRHIDQHNLDAEVLYAWGGNCAIVFKDLPTARKFATQLSLQTLSHAPDLEIALVHRPFEWSRLTEAVDVARKEPARKKLQRRIPTPLLGEGTTMACRSTGLPAVATDAGLKPPQAVTRPVSASILAKLQHLKAANDYLQEQLSQFADAGLDIPYDFDNFGRQVGEISYIAVVHADGNHMGDRIDRLRANFTDKGPREYIQAMRGFTRAVDAASQQALEAISTVLLRHWDAAHARIAGKYVNEFGELTELDDKPIELAKGERYYIPFRPLAFGGDDLTFVADGRLGISLTAAYLAAYEEAMAGQNDPYLQDVHASAGIAIVKSHYPFSRAYELAVDLCRTAKTEWNRACSTIDWHIAATGLFGEVKTIRESQYHPPAGRLTMRPVQLRQGVDTWRSWPGFASVAKEFLTGEAWKDKHNKVIALQRALRERDQAVERFRTIYELDALPELSSAIPALQTTGWDGDRCGYFDVVEALDFFLPLEG